MNTKDLCHYLNRLLLIDREAISRLFDNRVFCDSDLSKECVLYSADKCHQIGILGLLNGFFVPDTLKGRIAANYYEGTTDIQCFSIIDHD